ncbi:MAG: flagellar biosynthesis protein FlhA [Pseudomonadota bacterium]
MNIVTTFLTKYFAGRQDLVLVVFMFIFILMFIIPMPAAVVDVLIALNIMMTLIVLVTSTYLKGPADLSTFPALILFTTIFRLSITVAAARLILTTGTGGDVIKTFGNFVVGGNVMIGLVVFFIIAIVQFIVVVKGAERIAEVGARFTLDALPGKQMSIDSDLRNGDITKEEARARRSRLEKESSFFGAMDGSLRFVKGDAIANFIVIFVNLIGGLVVGMVSKGMSFTQAIHTFSILTIGEGLVSQIPAMFIAIAAGIVATRVTSEDSRHLGGDIARELSAETRALYVAAVVLAVVGLLPGFPHFIFFALALMIAGMAYLVTRRRAIEESDKVQRQTDAEDALREQMEADNNEEGEGGGLDEDGNQRPVRQPDLPEGELGDIFVIALHPDLWSEWQEKGMTRNMRQLTHRTQLELGLNVSDFTYRKQPQLNPGSYQILVEDVPVFRGQYDAEKSYATLSPDDAGRLGLTQNYVTNTQIGSLVELTPAQQEAVQDANLPSMDALNRVMQEADAIHRRYAGRAYGISEASIWLDGLEARYGRLVGEIKSNVPMLKLVEIGRRLLDENVPLAQPRVMLESLLQASAMDLDATDTVELVRRALARQIIWRYANRDGEIDAILIEPAAESIIHDIVTKSPADLAAQKTGEQLSGLTFARSIQQVNQEAMNSGMRPVLLTSAPIRPMARMMLVRNGVQVPVISFQEIGNDVQVRPLRAMGPSDLGLD